MDRVIHKHGAPVPGAEVRSTKTFLGVPMHRALRTVAAALAARLRWAACLFALATGGSIAVAARVGEHVAGRAQNPEQ